MPVEVRTFILFHYLYFFLLYCDHDYWKYTMYVNYV